MASENYPQKKLLFCNQCKTVTNHVLNGYHHREDNEEQYAGWWEESNFFFWVCAGCDSAVLEEDYTNAALDQEHGKHEFVILPKPSLFHLQEKHFVKLPQKLKTIYHETILAFNEEIHILTAAGLRALIEGICSDKQISGRNLKEKIDNLNTLLPQNIVTNLHSFRFIGNEAVHELEVPSAHDLSLAIEVSEDLLNFLYELDYKSSRLMENRRTS